MARSPTRFNPYWCRVADLLGSHLGQVADPMIEAHNYLSFGFVFQNMGNVPADITAWEVHGTLMDYHGHEQPVNQMEPIQNPIGRSLAPHECAMLEVHFVGGDLPTPVLPFRLSARVEYRGVALLTYHTEFDAERTGESWTKQGQRMR